MPNLPAHIGLAHQAAQQLQHPTLDGNLGYFLLGSTSPDMRVITRGRREEYHFAPLTFADVGAGVAGLFESHPDLGAESSQDGRTRAFMAGYITHLLADERWIVDMYRPYFGNSDVFPDQVYGNVMDRALQLELDRQSIRVTRATLSALAGANEEIEIGFIPAQTIEDWRRWVVDHIEGHFSWERLKFMATRIAAGAPDHPAHGIAEEFVRTLPESIDRLHEDVPRRDFDGYQEQTVEHLVRFLGDYLA